MTYRVTMIPTNYSVSVIIPVYNGERFLSDAIASIQAQNHHPLEILVVDDGSSDGTGRIAMNMGSSVRYVHQQNAGPPAARNRGLQLASADIITFLDVDDLWTRDKLAVQLRHFERDPQLDIVVGYTQCMVLSPDGHTSSAFRPFAEPWFAWSLGSAAIRRSVFDRVGLFDRTQFYCDDIDWFLRAREFGASIVIHQETVQYYRRHTSNISREKSIDQKYLAAAIKKSLKRRREPGHVLARPLPDALDSYYQRSR